MCISRTPKPKARNALSMSHGPRSTRCLCQTSDIAEAAPTPQPTASEGPAALKMINGPDVCCDALPRQSLYSSLSGVYAAPQTLDTARIFIPSSMHIHGEVWWSWWWWRCWRRRVRWAGSGGGEGVYMSSQCSAECRSRRRMLIQLYGSCSLVPMATVFALEQKSCISCLAIKDHCQARERGLPTTKSHQHYCKELLMLIFGTTRELSDAAVEDLLSFFPLILAQHRFTVLFLGRHYSSICLE